MTDHPNRDHPTEFTIQSARGIREGIKTQTRRLAFSRGVERPGRDGETKKSPLAKVRVGDRLYVREPYRAGANYNTFKPRELPVGTMLYFPADHPDGHLPPSWTGKSRPGRFMPRVLSRTTLIITEVRTEKLLQITETDAIKEGVSPVSWPSDTPYRQAYLNLWDQLHPGHPSTTNPTVIAITWRAVLSNIDRIEQGAAA